MNPKPLNLDDFSKPMATVKRLPPRPKKGKEKKPVSGE